MVETVEASNAQIVVGRFTAGDAFELLIGGRRVEYRPHAGETQESVAAGIATQINRHGGGWRAIATGAFVDLFA